MFIDLDILGLEQITIDYRRELLIINNCKDITILMIVISLKDHVKCVVKAHQAIIISSHFIIMISIRLRGKINFLIDHDLMFMSSHDIKRFELKNDILSYIVDANMCVV